MSFSDSKEGNSGLTTSDGEEDSGKSLISLERRVLDDDKEGLSTVSSNMKDIHMNRLEGENNVRGAVVSIR